MAINYCNEIVQKIIDPEINTICQLLLLLYKILNSNLRRYTLKKTKEIQKIQNQKKKLYSFNQY